MQKGTKMTEKAKELIRKAHLGKPQPKASEETKKLMSKIRTEWWRKKKLAKESSI